MSSGKMTVLTSRLKQAQQGYQSAVAIDDKELQKQSLETIFNCYIEMSMVAEGIDLTRQYREQASAVADKILHLNSKIDLSSKQKVEVDNDYEGSIDVTFKDIIGMQDVKEEINKIVIDPIKYPEYFKPFGKLVKNTGGIILTGDPGNGKTYFAKAIAGEVNANFFKSVKLGEVLSNSPGAPEKYIQALFSEARSHKISIIFFDEFDAIASKRGDSDNAKSIDNKLVDALLQQIDGFSSNQENTLLLIAATNRIDLIDEAITRPGRFDQVFEVKNPDIQARQTKLMMELSKVQTSELDYNQLAIETNGFSFADLQYTVVDACRRAISEGIKQAAKPSEVTIRLSHLLDAIKGLKLSYQTKGISK